MLIPRSVVMTVLIGITLLWGGWASGQDFPTKPIRLVTGGVGGNSDTLARYVAQGVSGPLGQQVVVVNYPSGNVPGQTVAKAPPDGYTLLVAGATLWIGPLFQKTPPYDPEKDFAPVSLAISDPVMLVVHPALPVKTVKELIALAKAKPNQLNYASGQTGAQSQLAGELFKYMAGVKMQTIPYPVGSRRITDLVAGDTQVLIDSVGLLTPLVKAGKLRAIAVGGLTRSALAPELPTISESGVPGYDSKSRTGIFAPAKTPDPIIRRLNEAFVRFLSLPDTKEHLLKTGVEAEASTPQELAKMVSTERDRLSKVIKAAGIEAQ